ncbi:MAG: hypothetical protein ABSE40_18110 [Candidatus Sulfotelmatobacter sp.]
MPLDLEIPVLPCEAAKVLLRIALFLLFCVTPVLSQKAEPSDAGLPKYDLHTGTKTKGVVEEVNLLSVGTRKDFTELIIKSGDEKVHVYVCPKPFQDEMGISFSEGDEIAVTGSKVKQEASDIVLARELVKGTDTLLFRDDKGKPIWDWHTGK